MTAATSLSNTQWTVETTGDRGPGVDTSGTRLGLMLAWYRHAPARVGEVLLVPPGARRLTRLGRGPARTAEHDDGQWVQQRPGQNTPTGPLSDPRLSRTQLLLQLAPDGSYLRVEQAGRGELALNGRLVTTTTARPGDVLTLRGRLVLLVVARPKTLAPAPSADSQTAAQLPFGAADPFGFVGESEATWALRDLVGFVARRPQHVLILGESGVGKELVARAIHEQSPRAPAGLVVRNAATIPEGLVDAELFGNVKNYPNPGMPARPGLVGEADGGTLFLDELGELPEALQAHLLRVLDSGDYQRLGDAKRHRVDVRLVAATNRALSELRHDLVPRFAARIGVPSLNLRRDDIPLLVRHLLARMVAADRELATRFPEAAADPLAIVSDDLMRVLLQHTYSHHVRELDGLLFRAVVSCRGQVLEPAPDLMAHVPGVSEAEPVAPKPREVTREEIVAALERCDGVLEQAWRDLGLSSRYVLRRLMKRHGIGGPS